MQEIDCLPVTEAYVLPAETAVDIDWGRMKNRVDMYQLPSELELGNSIDLPSQVKLQSLTNSFFFMFNVDGKKNGKCKLKFFLGSFGRPWRIYAG